jgi:carbohydrate-selective porin OprB
MRGLLLAAASLAAAPAAAQGLTGDWGGARTSLAQSGVSLRGDITGFAMGQIAGTGDKVWDASGRDDAFADLDFGKMGLVKGLCFHVHAEGRFGEGQSNYGFQLWPANTGATLPLGGEGLAASSLYFTQALGKRTVLLLGKVNAVDLLALDPVFGGWGTQRFQNIAFVAPPSGVVPPTIIRSSFILGLAGHGMVKSRPNDSFGVGGFIYNFSNALQDSAAPLVDFNDEQGVEAWYSFAPTPWFKLTGDAQYVNVARGDADPALIAGLRANLVF